MSNEWEELPKDWLQGLCIETQVASDQYLTSSNKYGVRSGKTMGKARPQTLDLGSSKHSTLDLIFGCLGQMRSCDAIAEAQCRV